MTFNKRKCRFMFTLVERTVVFYITLMLLMRVSGKRQVGELQLSEFVTAVMISELAVLPITSKDIPVLYCYVPLITVIFLEVFISFICKKNVKLRRFFDSSPVVLVSRGKVLEKNLLKTRVSIDEIFSEIRLNGYKDISDIQYVVLEQNGRLSVVPKRKNNNLTPEDINLNVVENGIGHCIIVDGYVDKNALEAYGKNETWLNERIKSKGITDKNKIWYYIIDDTDKEIIKLKKL